MKLVHAALCVALFSASFDYFLAIQLGGTLRLAQVMMAFVVLAAFWQVVQSRVILWPRGATAMAIWLILQAILLQRSILPSSISLQLYLLLVTTIASVFAVVQLYGRSDRITSLMKAYLSSFIFICCFCVFQFVSPVLHLGHWFVAQWIIHDVFPRINGFSYEPSYFVTYLVVGWIMLLDLRLSGALMVQGNRWKWGLILMTAVFFLSTSKLGWIMMLLELFLRMLTPVRRFLVQQLQRFTIGSLTIPMPPRRFYGRVLISIAVVVLLLSQLSKMVNLTIFVAGSGLANTTNQSLDDRLNGMAITSMVVHENPWIGLSLGGVTARIAQMQGADVHSMNDLRTHWAGPVPLEVLAGGGILGTIPFLWFFLAITVGERRLIRDNPNDERAKWLKAMIRALAFQWLCLCANQNLIRIYLWLHVTMIVVVGYHLRFSHDLPQTVPAEPEQAAPPALQPSHPGSPAHDPLPA